MAAGEEAAPAAESGPNPSPTLPGFERTRTFYISLAILVIGYFAMFILIRRFSWMRAQTLEEQRTLRALVLEETAIARSIPVSRYSAYLEEISASGDLEHQASCAVCLGDFCEEDEVKNLKCRHIYHGACLDQWLSRSNICPMCKRNVEPPSAESGGLGDGANPAEPQSELAAEIERVSEERRDETLAPVSGGGSGAVEGGGPEAGSPEHATSRLRVRVSEAGRYATGSTI
eukprot:CAMPEP_0172584022 /NCGR_PEP_ID=MMETSP1068-20121228/3592_1 /TAXON_ID=35684 /ORGANISM="Pseudopedinella elastica, Strain CCMP716" /LENGTH=230 /DNA_ID=CAMNT_0013378045 /DNA_START=158 /DNA_END=850 /DNA_ORIENTATION=-